MNVIKLTELTSKGEIFANQDKILYFRRILRNANHPVREYTMVKFSEDYSIEVIETPKQIILMLKIGGSVTPSDLG
jgi:hypothetical protein